MEIKKGGSVLGGTLIVAGTSIGGGMLALPVLTSLGGFLPAVIIYLLCWLFMACTGLLLMEVYLWLNKEANLVSMAKFTLGMPGKIAAWILYLFLFYCLTVAYISGGGHLIGDAMQEFPLKIPSWLGSLVFVCIFAPFVYIGAQAVDRINRVFMAGLILSFLLFVILDFRFVNTDFLKDRQWGFALLATPVVFTSFGFQGIVPTLTNYMQRDPWKIRKAIFFGSGIPFITYVLWEWLILGSVPVEGKYGLKEAIALGETAVYPLRYIVGNPWIYTIGQFFAFFAIVTSFLGVTLGLLDFLADGLSLEKTALSRFWLCLLIFIPSFAIASTNPRFFLIALDLAGGFGCALLLGLLPILMAWSGRYYLHLKSTYALKGGKTLLLFLIFFILLEIVIMVYKLI